MQLSCRDASNKLLGDQAAWDPDYRRHAFHYQLSNMNRHHSMMPQVLARIERRARQAHFVMEKNKTRREISDLLRLMRSSGFQNKGPRQDISHKRLMLLEVIGKIRWRYPSELRPTWGFTLSKTGCCGLMFNEPLEVALFIIQSWGASWPEHVRLQKPNDPEQPQNDKLYQAFRELSLLPRAADKSRKRPFAATK